MKLVHTLLFMFREDNAKEDTLMAYNCLKSLEKSTYKTLVVYNQGSMSCDTLKDFLSDFDLDCHVIGSGANLGTVIGRQKCFEYIWENMQDADYISELHPDMIFTNHWEDALVDYLENHDEPVISCGIVDKHGIMPFLDKPTIPPQDFSQYDVFLANLRTDSIVHGFANPCIHVSRILKEIGGYNPMFLKGRQCFEDDSMLLGYYYYYGSRHNWYPKINYNSVIYHAVAGQRLGIQGNVMINFNGLVKQYGLMGLKALSTLHSSAWHKKFFTDKFNENINKFFV